jgi:hypothetical protein
MNVDDLTRLVTDILTLVVAAIVLLRTTRTKKTVDQVHDELKTANGLSVGKLADNAEGRRIVADIARIDRTSSEQRYVEGISTEGHPHET